MTAIILEDIPIPITFKKMKHLHLKVHKTHGTVTISAPLRTPSTTIHAFAATHLEWINQRLAIAETLKQPQTPILSDIHQPLWCNVWGSAIY